MADSPIGHHAAITSTSWCRPLEPGQIPIWRGWEYPIGAWPRNERSRLIHKVLFNFSERMFGQVLVYFRDNACLYISMECVSQFGEGFRRSHYDESLDLVRPDHLFHRRCDLLREAVLFDVMPIGWFESAPTACDGSFAHPSRPVAALLVGRRILLLKHPVSPEIRKFRVAIVSQEQGLSAVADKHQGIVGNFQHIHTFLKITQHPAGLRTWLCHTPNG